MPQAVYPGIQLPVTNAAGLAKGGGYWLSNDFDVNNQSTWDGIVIDPDGKIVGVGNIGITGWNDGLKSFQIGLDGKIQLLGTGMTGNDPGLLIGNPATGTGWAMNASGLGSWAGGFPLHAFALSDGIAWQQHSNANISPIDPAFTINTGDAVFGGYNYKWTATGVPLGGVFWDNLVPGGVPAFNLRGNLLSGSYIAGTQITALQNGATAGAIFGTNISGGGTGTNQVGNNGYVSAIAANIIVCDELAAIKAYLGSVTLSAGKSLTVDTSGSWGQILFSSVGSIYGSSITGNMLISPISDNNRNLYLGSGSNLKFATILQYASTFQWYRSATVSMQLDNSGLSVGGVAVSLSGHAHSGFMTNLDADKLDGNHANAFALAVHNHSGQNLSPASLTLNGSDVWTLLNSAAAMLANHESRLDAHGI